MSGWRDIQRGVAGSRDRLTGHLQRPARRQFEVLREILDRGRNTEFGIRHGFSTIRTVAEFQDRVPLLSYDDMHGDIARMMAGEPDVLCGEEIVVFEETGGSAGGRKFLPYTRSSLEAVRCAVLPWLDDLLLTRPAIMSGRAYWSISPVARDRSRTAAGIPIGMDSDAAYFGDELGRAIEETLAVPASVLMTDSMDEWRRLTLKYLLECRDLTFVSVWSPTFLLQLLDAISHDTDQAATDIEGADRRRAAEIREWGDNEPKDWEQLWPKLDTISCWTSASSRPYADEVRRRFPRAEIQGKGLLATEAAVTLPLADACAPVPAVSSAFFEFVDDRDRIATLEELESGACYSVVLTTAGGLNRYRIGDRVRVAGRYREAPCLEYVGRDDARSDLCGEKLHEEFVRQALAGVSGPSMLVPMQGTKPSYLLLLDAHAVAAEDELSVTESVDCALRMNPQYRYARELGQLAGLSSQRLADPVGLYHEVCLSAGRRLGDIKPVSLAGSWWADAFRNTRYR